MHDDGDRATEAGPKPGSGEDAAQARCAPASRSDIRIVTAGERGSVRSGRQSQVFINGKRLPFVTKVEATVMIEPDRPISSRLTLEMYGEIEIISDEDGPPTAI